MKIALTGNPNSGKTTLFNAITGRIEHVGNWAGVTVDKKEGPVKKTLNDSGVDITVVDLPGAYSMSPFTSEESITRDFVKNEAPDVIINIVDATNLNRSLFFTTQLLELNIPVVIALNKSDLTAKKKTKINTTLLSQLLKCPVVETISTQSKNEGLKRLIKEAVKVNGDQQEAPFTGVGDQATKEEVLTADKERYAFIAKLIKQVEKKVQQSKDTTLQDKADRIIANKWFGIPIFIVVMWAVFAISQTYVGTFFADILSGWIDTFGGFVSNQLGSDVDPFLSALLVDGIIGGVGAVVGFLPLIMVLFFLLALLEDCGYMARVAVVMDRFFKKVGLSGKSIIPMIIGTGCAIPGIMATRTIKNDRQRRTTAMLTPFMPCGAKLPIIALFSGVFFNNSAVVSVGMYALGILLIIISALMIRRITGERKSKSYFIMELPEYRIPSLKRAVVSMFSRAKAFIIKAGTIILVCNALIQIMQTFSWSNGHFQMVAEGAENTSILATIASPFAILLLPLGFGVWQLAAAAITGFIAKENVVGTLAVVYGITNFIDPDELVLVGGGSDVATIMGISSVAALSYLTFNLFTPPCFAAIGAMNSELESPKWLWGAIGFQLSMGYIVAFIIYQLGTLITTGSLGQYFIQGLIAVAIFIGTYIYLMIKGDRKAELAHA